MKTRMLVKIATALTLAIGAVACGGSAANPTGSTPPLAETGGSASAQAQGLVGTWQLVSLAEAGQAPVIVTQPEQFTAEFTADGHVSLRADCNRCAGGYTAKGDSLSIGPMACTKAYCSSAPLDMNFTALVSQATAWNAASGGLVLRSEGGVLILRR